MFATGITCPVAQREKPCAEEGWMLAGGGQCSALWERAVPSLLGISFGGGQRHCEWEEGSQLFGFVLIKEVNGKQNQTHLAPAAQGVPTAGNFPPPAVKAWPGCSRIREERTSSKGTGWPRERSEGMHLFLTTAFLPGSPPPPPCPRNKPSWVPTQPQMCFLGSSVLWLFVGISEEVMEEQFKRQ